MLPFKDFYKKITNDTIKEANDLQVVTKNPENPFMNDSKPSQTSPQIQYQDQNQYSTKSIVQEQNQQMMPQQQSNMLNQLNNQQISQKTLTLKKDFTQLQPHSSDTNSTDKISNRQILGNIGSSRQFVVQQPIQELSMENINSSRKDTTNSM